MPTEFSRHLRIAQELKRILAPWIQQKAKDAQLGMVTITAVEVTPDLRQAKIYITSLGAKSHPATRRRSWHGSINRRGSCGIICPSICGCGWSHNLGLYSMNRSSGGRGSRLCSTLLAKRVPRVCHRKKNSQTPDERGAQPSRAGY